MGILPIALRAACGSPIRQSCRIVRTNSPISVQELALVIHHVFQVHRGFFLAGLVDQHQQADPFDAFEVDFFLQREQDRPLGISVAG